MYCRLVFVWRRTSKPNPPMLVCSSARYDHPQFMVTRILHVQSLYASVEVELQVKKNTWARRGAARRAPECTKYMHPDPRRWLVLLLFEVGCINSSVPAKPPYHRNLGVRRACALCVSQQQQQEFDSISYLWSSLRGRSRLRRWASLAAACKRSASHGARIIPTCVLGPRPASLSTL